MKWFTWSIWDLSPRTWRINRSQINHNIGLNGWWTRMLLARESGCFPSELIIRTEQAEFRGCKRIREGHPWVIEDPLNDYPPWWR